MMKVHEPPNSATLSAQPLRRCQLCIEGLIGIMGNRVPGDQSPEDCPFALG